MAASKFRPTIRIGFCLTLIWLVLTTPLLANNPPQLSPVGNKRAVFGEPLAFNLSASDPEKQGLFYSGVDLPINSILNPTTGYFNWSPTINQVGTYRFTFVVSDNGIPSLATQETIVCQVVYRLPQAETKALGFKEEAGGAFETSLPSDLYPRIASYTVDGKTALASEKTVTVSENPTIKFTVSSPYNVDQSDLWAYLDDQKIDVTTYVVTKTYGTKKNTLSADFELSPRGLSPGMHILSFKTGNELGFTTYSLSLNVGGGAAAQGGPIRITDTPLCFPNPFNPAAGGPATLQYTLSANADIELIIVGASGQILKKTLYFSGQSGGLAGLNKVTWDGKSDFGALAGNGIYLGTIIDRGSQTVLGKVKIAVFQ